MGKDLKVFWVLLPCVVFCRTVCSYRMVDHNTEAL